MTYWETVDRPGYFGTGRDEIYAEYNRKFGKSGWRIAWQWGEGVIERPMALQLYEDGYYEFFKTNPNTLRWLTTNASDVYDTDPSNAGQFDYERQETPSNHIHDVAIRRAVLRNGAWFNGNRLLHVRPKNEEGDILNPHKIPFHLPNMIYRGQIKYKGKERDFSVNPPWWIKMGVPNSIEEFYQQNKVLQESQEPF